MSRVGNAPIEVPEKVSVEIAGNRVTVKGPKGEMSVSLPPVITVEQEGRKLVVKRHAEHKQARSYHGLYARLLANFIIGVSAGFQKKLEVIGVGYRVQLEGPKLVMQIGFSHPVVIDPPQGIKFEVDGNQKIIVSGCDKQVVGETAARIRRCRPPEPYKGKGIRYEGEWVRRKAGKALA
ncbi:MAG TPA: 50S ribosomal protein L6 [bacterium]|nr:50S ribosomal protein L6 [bacterium]HPJ71476.1 50S ribosomal protein L6 [bacterium]HPQ65959.1 50S ribosomal protein L6 [bacterium]